MSRSRVAVFAAIAIAVLAACSFGSDHLPTGQSSVNVNGGKLAYWCEGSGSPTVVIKQGLFRNPLPEFDEDDWYGWGSALRGISDFTHVCVYNRRGVPRSDPLALDVVRTCQDHADDLLAFVETLGLPEQIVLVGHSWGGLDIQLFALQHLDRVFALVLVDSSHPQGSEFIGFRAAASPEWVDIPQSEDSFDGVANLRDIPVVVLSQGTYLEATASQAETWADLQADLTGLSSNSQHIVLPDSGHLVMIDRPDAIVEAVRAVIDQMP